MTNWCFAPRYGEWWDSIRLEFREDTHTYRQILVTVGDISTYNQRKGGERRGTTDISFPEEATSRDILFQAIVYAKVDGFFIAHETKNFE